MSSEVSVVVPTRNRSALLALTLRSVLAQRDVGLDVIVVDEASSDDTAAVLAAFADARLHVIRHETPCGVASARNRGAAAARGEWLAFVDDDDLWAPDKLARQLQEAQAVGRHWAYTGCVNIGDRGEIISGRPPLGPEQVLAALPRFNAIPGGGSNVVVRQTTWQKAGPFDTRLRNTEDWEMWIRLARLGPPACVRDPLLAYRVHTSNSSLNVGEIVRGAKLIEDLHSTTVDWGILHRWMAESCLRRGQRRAALREFIAAGAHGQVGGVVADLTALVRRRFAPRSSVIDTANGAPQDLWIAGAARWLAQLDGHNPVRTQRAAGAGR